MNTNTNTAPAPSPEPMRLLFLEAMEWGRFFWAQRSVPDITLREVSQDFADKAALSTAGWVMVPVEPTEAMADAFENAMETATTHIRNFNAAYRAMNAAAPKPHVQIPQENVHDKGGVAKKTEQLDTSGPAVATKEMLIAAVKYVNGGDIYEKLPLEVLEIEESIYGEIYWVMAEAAPKATKATKAEPVQPERAPLSDEQIDAIFDPRDGAMQGLQEMARRFARKIERHHGIQPAHKEQPNG